MGIIRQIVSVSALTWFIRYIYVINLQLLIYVIIIKTKVLIPQVTLTYFDPVLALWFYCPHFLNYLSFQSFDLMKMNPETCRAH